MTKECIFCRKGASESKSKEHILPKSLGYDYMLEPGIVCDKCNTKILSKLDETFQKHHFIYFLKPMLHRIGEKEFKEGLVIKNLPKGVASIECGEKQTFRDGGKLGVITLKVRRKPVNLQQVSRALHKIAIETYCYKHGRKRTLFKKFDKARNYVRFPGSDEYRIFGQKNSSMQERRFDIGVDAKGYVQINVYDMNFLVSIDRELDREQLKKQGYEVVGKEEYEKSMRLRKLPEKYWIEERIHLVFEPTIDLQGLPKNTKKGLRLTLFSREN